MYKNKTFFRADSEAIREAKGIAHVGFVPSPAVRQGTLQCTSDDVKNNAHGCTTTPSTYTVTVDPAVQKYLTLYPTPTCSGANVCQFIFNGNQVISENFVTTRVDHKFSEKDSLFGTYLFDKTPYSSPDSFGNVGLTTLSSRQIVAVEETHSFTPTFVNAVRFGYNHERVDNDASVKAINPAAAHTSLGSFSVRNASFVNVNGLSALPGGVGGLPTYLYRWNSFQGYDDAFLTRGTHTINFGVAAETIFLQLT